MNYRQVMLYGVRTPIGEDILEGEHVTVETISGDEYDGILNDAGSQYIELTYAGTDDDETITVDYSDIKSLRI